MDCDNPLIKNDIIVIQSNFLDSSLKNVNNDESVIDNDLQIDFNMVLK
jgi:hypothetical protein